MKKFFLLFIGSLVLTACSGTTVTQEPTNEAWLTFESTDVGIRFQYPSELEWSLSATELQGFDTGYRRGYSFSGMVDGIDISFFLDATTADFGYGISEGCCWAFGGPAIDLSKSDEEIMEDLARGVDHEEQPENWKLLEVYSLEHLTLGSHAAIRFADLTGFVGYFVGDNYLIPNPNGEFTNIIVSWRGSEMFTNLEGEISYEEFFAQIEDFADIWMDDLTEPEKEEKALIEEILSTLEFMDVQPEELSSSSIPDAIVEQANQYIVSRVGSDFFESYVSMNEESSQYYPADDYCVEFPGECSAFLQEPHYLMVYSLKIPEKPFVDGLIEINLDENGELISEVEPSGVPNCIEEPTECEFPIDEARALEIAKEAGLEEGIKEWGVGSVHWYGGDLDTYVWGISNTLREDDDGSAGGQAVIIDANTGEVMDEIMSWIRTP